MGVGIPQPAGSARTRWLPQRGGVEVRRRRRMERRWEPVTRMQPVVRPASAEDLPAIEEMWGELRETGGRFGRAMSDPAAASAGLAKLIVDHQKVQLLP